MFPMGSPTGYAVLSGNGIIIQEKPAKSKASAGCFTKKMRIELDSPLRGRYNDCIRRKQTEGMAMTGTLINTAAVLIGGVCGQLFGRLLKPRFQETLTLACGVSTLFLSTAGALRYMLPLDAQSLPGGGAMLIILCVALGGLIGEILNIERGLERFGEWLKRKTGSARDQNFVNGFLTASLTTCVGAMTVVGSLQDGIAGDWSILGAKSILDLVIVAVLTSSLGRGCVFSVIPIFVIEGGLTLLANWIKPLMTDLAMSYLSTVGSVLIFCVGVNLVWDRKIRVANLLPAVVLAVAAAFLPIRF